VDWQRTQCYAGAELRADYALALPAKAVKYLRMHGSRSAIINLSKALRPMDIPASPRLGEHDDEVLAFPMSGIGGLVRLDDQIVTRHELERVANTLSQYGPDRSEIIAIGNVGLVHVLMRMTPEDRFDSQPWRGASGSLITADVRLDNRDDVLARIGISRQEASAWADSRVLMTGWEKLGDEIWPMLRGPFAVAIWDPHNRALTLARDHLGLNVVMWHRSRRSFAFATMPKGLFALAGVPRELSEEKFADFLVLNHADHATTMYRNVFRVPPAHYMRVKHDGSISQKRYWSPDKIKTVALSSDADYADGLRERLDLAVRRQMRSSHPIGSLLSGGLDSSSVSVLAARALAERNQRLSAFTGVPRRGFAGPVPSGHYADETPYVEAIQRTARNIDVTYVQNNECNDFAEFERVFLALEGPIRNPTNLGWLLTTLRLARGQGRRVLLGGLYGNYTISWDGWSQAVVHLLHGRLLTAYRQWQLYYRRTSYSRWVALRKLFVEPLVPKWMGDWADRRRHPSRIAAWQDHAAIRPDFAATMAVDARAQKFGHDFLYRMRQDERVRGLAQIDYIGDWHAAEKAITGVEVRDPTADIDVVSYCFGIPPEQYLAEGIDRSLIRRAMWGLLPEIILTNRSRGLQAPDWYEKLEHQRGELAHKIAEISESPLVSRTIDLVRLQNAIKNWPISDWHTAKVFQEHNLALTRGVAGGCFLRWFESANRQSGITSQPLKGDVPTFNGLLRNS
jgi:asparagine synthase (glutamine-hydrolysing)